VENDRRLLDGWRGGDDTSCHHQTCMLALLSVAEINRLNAELNPICHLLVLLGAHPILHISRIKVNVHVMKSQENRFVTVMPIYLASVLCSS